MALQAHELRQVHRVAQHAYLYSQIAQHRFFEWLTEKFGEENQIDFDREVNEAVISSSRGSMTVRGSIIASITSLPTTLMWGWCPRYIEHTVAHPITVAMREYGERHGLSEFVTEEVPYSKEVSPRILLSELASDVASCVHDIFGPNYRFYMPQVNVFGHRVTIALWGLPREALFVDFLEAVGYLPNIIPRVDDPAWSLDGFARLMGAQLTEVGLDWWRLTKQGQSVEIALKRDGEGNLRDVEMRKLSDDALPSKRGADSYEMPW